MSDSIFEADIVRRVIKANIYRPLNDHVFVYRVKLDRTAGGIALPESVNPRSSMGLTTLVIVIAVGPGRFIELTGGREPIHLKPGDMIMVSAQAGLEFGQVVRRELGSDFALEEIRTMRAHDIICEIPGRNILEQGAGVRE